MKRTIWLSLSLVLWLASCASTTEELPPPVDLDVDPVVETGNTDAGWFGITETVETDGALLELPQSFDTQLVHTTSAVEINDRWMPEVQVLLSSDELVDVSVALSVRPIDPDSGDALVDNELQREATRTTDGNQTWLHLHREAAPWWRTVVFVPVADTMWVVDFIGEGIEREQFHDFVVATMQEATFHEYPHEQKLEQARQRANGKNVDDRRLPER